MPEVIDNMLAVQNAYKKSVDIALKIFEVARILPSGNSGSPANELIFQSSEVCNHLSNAWHERQNVVHYATSLTQALRCVDKVMEQLTFAVKYEFLDEETGSYVLKTYDDISLLLKEMLRAPAS